jgi:hypothetical protein
MEQNHSSIRNPRLPIIATAIALAAAAGFVDRSPAANAVNQRPTESQPFKPEKTSLDQFTKQLGDSLINLHEQSHGGWRFKSEVQSPHYQTDRDVGASSVGMGFLAMANRYPHDGRWIHAAKQTASWLEAVSSKDKHGGRYWHDYSDNHEVSSDIYTSFDDGTIGIGDFFWQLYEKTKDPEYKKVALESLQWTFSQAEAFSEGGIKGYRWKWNVGQKQSPYYMGMGEGAVGIVTTLTKRG